MAWPHLQALPMAPEAAKLAQAGGAAGASPGDAGEQALPDEQAHTMGSLIEFSDSEEGHRFALFDLNRDQESELPETALAPLTPQAALETLGERPLVFDSSGGPLRLGSRSFESLRRLRDDLAEVLLEHVSGRHLRLQDDEDIVKVLLTYHPDTDRLLDDTVAIKVDSSPIDDSTRCFWVIKFDGYEEDVSIRTCLRGLENYLRLEGAKGGGQPRIRRLGPGRWTKGLRETTYDRARTEEGVAREADSS